MAPIDVPIDGQTSVSIARYLRAERRHGGSIERDVNCWAPNKPVLDFDGLPTWAEYVLVRLLERAGWDARWVKNWVGGREFCSDVGLPVAMPPEATAVFTRIDQRAASKTGGGAWDIFAWREGEYLFLESKKHKSGDRLRPGQVSWLAAALSEGFRAEQFAIVEYEPL